MAENPTQEQTPPAPAAEPTKPEPKPEEHMIPKSRFDEVNNRAKDAETKLAALEAEKAEAERKALEESGKYKELYGKEQAEKARLEIEVLKRDLISEAINSKELHPRLAKMVTGNTEEELKKSLEDAKAYHKELQEQIKNDTTAADNSGNGNKTPTAPMSQEEYMKLYAENPTEAKRRLREMTDAGNK